MSDKQLQRDIETLEALLNFDGWDMVPMRKHAEAWQRLKPRLTPDRERVARAIESAHEAWAYAPEDEREWPAVCADAAIDAMGETP